MVKLESKKEIEDFNKGKESKGVTIDANGETEITINGQIYKLHVNTNEDGSFSMDGVEGSFKTPIELLRAWVRQTFKDTKFANGLTPNDYTDEQLDIIMGFKVVPKITGTYQLAED